MQCIICHQGFCTSTGDTRWETIRMLIIGFQQNIYVIVTYKKIEYKTTTNPYLSRWSRPHGPIDFMALIYNKKIGRNDILAVEKKYNISI